MTARSIIHPMTQLIGPPRSPSPDAKRKENRAPMSQPNRRIVNPLHQQWLGTWEVRFGAWSVEPRSGAEIGEEVTR